MPDKIKIDNLYGHSEIYPTIKREGEDFIFGGICKKFDGSGILIKETKEDNIRMFMSCPTTTK